MPNYSKEWTETTLIVPKNIILSFNKDDTKLVRNWSESGNYQSELKDRARVKN